MPNVRESDTIAGVYIVEPSIHGDQRGLFIETYRREWFPNGREMVQRNRSKASSVPFGGGNGPPRIDHVVGDGDHLPHPDAIGMVEDRGDRLGVTTATCGEMGMRIDEPGQRVRIRWRFAATLLGHRGLRRHGSAVPRSAWAKAHSMGPILARPAMGRVVAHADAQSRSVSEMLGLPDSITVALFDLDGVLTDTASVHLTAWTEAFNDFLAHVTDADGNTTSSTLTWHRATR